MYKRIFILSVLIFQTSGKVSLGKCPDVEPVPAFSTERFLGYWYAIQATSAPTPCLLYHVFHDQETGHYKIAEIQQHSTIWPSAFHHEHNTTGNLIIPNSAEPGRMNLALPGDIGDFTFTIFKTDYDNYAAIFLCKNLGLLYSWSAKILSRTKTLDMAFVDEIRTRLASYNVDPSNLEGVPQKLCPKPGAKGSFVRAASNVVTNAGRKISSMVSDFGQSLYNLTLDPKDDSREKCSNVLCELEESTRSLSLDNCVNNVGDEREVPVGKIGKRSL